MVRVTGVLQQSEVGRVRELITAQISLRDKHKPSHILDTTLAMKSTLHTFRILLLRSRSHVATI